MVEFPTAKVELIGFAAERTSFWEVNFRSDEPNCVPKAPLNRQKDDDEK